MIQDAHPLRSGTPDGYDALYRIEVLVNNTTWNVNRDRLPSGFTGANVSPNPEQVRTGPGLGTITFPSGMKVRHAVASVSGPAGVDAAGQRQAFVTDIDETAGTARIVITTAPGVISDPVNPTAAPAPNDSWIMVRLTLETV